MVLKYSISLIIGFVIITSSASEDEDWEFELSLIHLNDFHARYEESTPTSGVCKSLDCIGGFSRVYTAINQLVKDRPNPVVLNAGDNFQGTFWYNVYKWNVTQYFFNKLPTDVYTLGNHEFDGGIKGLVPYLKALKAPTVAANIDDSDEPDLHGLYKKSIVIKRDGKKIGIIGVISKRTHELSNTGKLRFLDESLSVNREAERLVADEDVDTIIVLSHCSYEVDQRIAQKAGPKIGVIVGGHSHTFLYTGDSLPGPDKPEGPYPTVINHEDGRKILVVQAAANSKYLGNITVRFDDDGEVVSWSGAPIYLNKSIPQDEAINEELNQWKIGLDDQGKKVVGYSNVLLQKSNCRVSECNLGNFVADAMVHSHLDTDEKDAWAYASIAITNSGSLRTSVPRGNVTYGDLATTVPFQNTIDVGELQGRYMREVLEYAAGHHNNTSTFDINLMPVSGIRVVYNMSRPIGERIQSLKVRCRKCLVPHYVELQPKKYYRVVVNSFIRNGGDGHTVLANNFNVLKVGETDIDVLVTYAQRQSPIIQEIDERIQLVQ